MAKTLTVDIKAQNQELKRKLKESQAYIKELEKTAKNSAKGVSGSFNGAKSSVSRFTQECKDAGKSISSAFSNLKSGNIEGAVSSLKGISGAAAGAAAGVAAIGTVAVVAGAKVASLVSEGIELAQQAEGVKHRFEEIGGTSIYLESLRQHTHGLVTDFELMKATVKAKDFNIPMKDLGTYLEFAQLKAQQTGESVDYLVDSIVTGLGRQSVQILDNLGISAAELKSKMAEGKTMTEAVAEVINNQLSEAGEHFETTAEKAQRKLVELENEQTRVGEGLAPLKAEWDSFLTSVEIWAMKAVQKVAALFSEAQRIQNLVNDMQQTSSGAPAHIHKFNNINTKEGKENYVKNYTNLQNKQINQLSGQIYKLEQQQKSLAFSTMPGQANYAHEVGKEIQKLKEKREALRQNRDEFLRYAKAQLAAGKTPVVPISGSDNKSGGRTGRRTGGRTGGSTPKVEPQEAPEGSIKWFDDQISKKRIEFSLATTPESRRQIQKEIDDLVSQKHTMELHAKIDWDALGKNSADISSIVKKQFTDIDFDAIAEEGKKKMGAVVDKINEEQIRKWQEAEEKKAKIKELQQQTIDSMINAASSAADAFDMPEFDIMGTIAQAVANIAMSYSEAAASPAVTGTGWGWIAFAAAGLAEMLAVVASIKSATSGYANGGIIGGSMMHGDNMLARVNSGEMILNGNQQSNLFNMINDGSSLMGGGNVHFVLRGADLYGSMKNFSKTKSLVGKNTGIK